MENHSQEIYELLIKCSENKDSRRWNRYRKDNPNLLINLSNTKLAKLQLREFNLSNINFEGSDMRNAKLLNANLKGANLTNVNLANANIMGADLRNSNQKDANFQMVKLDETTRMK